MPAVPAAAWAIRALMRGALLAAALLSPAAAQSDAAADTAIRTALTQWAADFNARRADKVCELFPPDLVAQFRGQPENDYRGLCDQLRRSLSDPAKAYSYAPTVKEILVFAEVAIVRLVWTLTVERKEPRVSHYRRARIGHLPAPTRRQVEDHSLHRVRSSAVSGTVRRATRCKSSRYRRSAGRTGSVAAGRSAGSSHW